MSQGTEVRYRHRTVFYLPGTTREAMENLCGDLNIDLLITALSDDFYNLLGQPEAAQELIAEVKKGNGGIVAIYPTLTIARRSLRPA
jgi:hypothetical protein